MSQDEQTKTTWESEADHPELTQGLREALREVVDPEIGLNIIELGLIRNVVVHPDKVNITMILTTPFCPYGPAMLDVTRQKAEKFLQRPTILEMGMEMWDLSMMEDGAGADWGLF